MKRLEEVLKKEGKNYMLPFFWQHGEDEATLREYMQVIHDANIGAVCVESRPHPDFVGDKWWIDMDVILDEAKRLGMKVWILDDSHFPTGFANGAVKNAPKELKHKYMCYRTLEMAGPVQQVEFEVKQYMKPAPPPPWIPAPPETGEDFSDDELVKIIACPILAKEELGTPIDLTACIQDGMVVFDLPDGYFKIFVVYITRNAKGRNDYINFMDEESCRLLIDTVYEPHYKHYKEYFGNVIAGFFSDEPPVGNVDGYIPVGAIGSANQALPWSKVAQERFTREYGSEEWMLNVPYLWGEAADKETQAKVRNAYMDTVSKLIAECFSKQNGEWCQAHGVEYIGHMLEDCDMNMRLGASMGHFFRGLSGQHMAGVDNIGQQVTINGHNITHHDASACRDESGFYQYTIGKLGASHGAIDPKKKGRCMCENFGAYGWQSGPTEQKFMMDHYMVRGVNYFVPHAFSPAPFPDPDCPPHFYAHGENPTYRAFGELMDYSNRVCHLIEGGTPCPDVAVLYAAESVWSGDDSSNIPACRYLSQAQVDFHIIPSDVFRKTDEYPMALDEGKLVINGVKYGALIISNTSRITKDVAKFIQEAMEASFPIVFTDRKPTGVIAGSEAENGHLVETISRLPLVPVDAIGIYFKENPIIPLQAVIKPDNALLTTYHYQLDGRDELLVLNEMAEKVYIGEITVNASGIPVRYYPWENRVEEVSSTQIEDGRQKLMLSMNPLELCVLVFLKDEGELAQLKETFGISSAGAQAGYQKAAVIKEFLCGQVESKEYLEQLKKAGVGLHSDKAIVIPGKQEKIIAPFAGMQKQYPDYSGFYVYETRIRLDEERQYQVFIDDVYETAEVFLNGVSLGTKVQHPYLYQVPDGLAKADNELRIEVATLPERKARLAGANIAAMSPDRPMSPTGIVGNVTILEK